MDTNSGDSFVQSFQVSPKELHGEWTKIAWFLPYSLGNPITAVLETDLALIFPRTHERNGTRGVGGEERKL
jgi:hypothetical protein